VGVTRRRSPFRERRLRPPIATRRSIAASLLGIVAGAGCGAELATEVSGCGASTVIYGSDDRREPFEVPADLAALARMRTVAIVEKRSFDDAVAGRIEGDALSFGGVYRLCPGERYAAQPSLSQCTGTLVAPDLVLTAGHCLHDASCDCYVYVGGYESSPRGEAPRLGEDLVVRRCAGILAFEDGRKTNAAARDFAWVRLDAPMPYAVVAPAVRSGALRLGENVTLAGHPAGLPLKIMGGQVVDPRGTSRDFFGADIDSFGGDSGGPVFDAHARLVGMAISGQEDFEYDDAAGCFRTRVGEVDVARAKYEYVAHLAPVLREGCRRGVEEACLVPLDPTGGACGH
jgi:V8-like Glu-specific endopeptidase